jgi:hypothetical protein
VKTVLRAGGLVDIPSLGEIRAEIEAGIGERVADQVGQLRDQVSGQIGGMAESLDAQLAGLAEIERQRARTVKFMRLPEVLRGVPAGDALTLGVSKGQMVGPEQGYVWSITRLAAGGLAASSSGTPDIVNFYRNDNFAGVPIWQLNGNSWATAFGAGEQILLPGDTLNMQNAAALAATGTITIAGDVLEVAAELAYKLWGISA